MPKEERQVLEEDDEILGYLSQSNMSQKNLRRLKELSASSNPRVSRPAGLVLEVGKCHPGKRGRLRALAREKPDLLGRLEEAHIAMWM
jgi:hypothetical protein